jgi:hypothetical protein
MAGAAKADHPVIGRARVLAATVITIATNPRRPERPPFARYAPRAMTPKIIRILPSMVPSRWLIMYLVVLTKRDHASNSVLGLGCGVRVAQAVNSPEIGRASRPIRIQLVVFVDEDNITLSVTPFLHWFLATCWEEDSKFGLQNHPMYQDNCPYRNAPWHYRRLCHTYIIPLLSIVIIFSIIFLAFSLSHHHPSRSKST